MMFRSLILFSVLVFLSSCATQQVASTNSSRDGEEISSVKKREAGLSKREERFNANKSDAGVYSANALRKKYAAKLNVEDEKTLDNLTLLAFIDNWYGVPYKYGGKDKKGIDCSTFACTLYQNLYKTNLSGTSLDLYQQCEKIKRANLQQGDLVFFKIYKGRISHVGVYVANDYFIHASTKAGVVLSNLNEDYYKKYYAGGGRVKVKNEE